MFHEAIANNSTHPKLSVLTITQRFCVCYKPENNITQHIFLYQKVLFHFFSLLISYIGSGDSNLWKGVVLSVLMLLSSFLHSLFANSRIFYSFLCGARARSVVNAAVYRKVGDFCRVVIIYHDQTCGSGLRKAVNQGSSE